MSSGLFVLDLQRPYTHVTGGVHRAPASFVRSFVRATPSDISAPFSTSSSYLGLRLTSSLAARSHRDNSVGRDHPPPAPPSSEGSFYTTIVQRIRCVVERSETGRVRNQGTPRAGRSVIVRQEGLLKVFATNVFPHRTIAGEHIWSPGGRSKMAVL